MKQQSMQRLDFANKVVCVPYFSIIFNADNFFGCLHDRSLVFCIEEVGNLSQRTSFRLQSMYVFGREICFDTPAV